MSPEEILSEFKSYGLLVRSVQAHRPELMPVAAPDYTVKSLDGVARQCYSLIHPTIAQPLYQMSPVDESGRPVDERTLEPADVAGNRGFAHLLSWRRTWRSIVDLALADASSGGTFNAKDALPTEEGAVEKLVAEFIPRAASASRGVNNEVRTVAVNNAALVGFIFSPSKPSPLNQCKPTFEETKDLITAYAKKVISQSASTNPVTEKEFPVFSYSLTTTGMSLNLLGTVG